MLSLSDISKLKCGVKDRFGVSVHFHDVCPKPFYTLDSTNEEIRLFISGFLGNLSLTPHFSHDGLQFTVERKQN